MQLTLRQITNTLTNQQNSHQQANLSNTKNPVKKDPNLKFPFKKLVTVSSTHLDYGNCIPGMVYQKSITINLKEDLSEPISFSLRILCPDQKLNDLPQFVFAVKRDKEFEYTDFMRFRINRKGCYDFVIGVKTPHFPAYHVKSELSIYTEFSDLTNPNDCYLVQLEQKVCMPVVECTRELESIKPIGDGKMLSLMRVLKFSQIKTKLKKQVRISFKLQTDTKLTLINEVLGGLPQRAQLQRGLLEISPKQINMLGKGVFLVSFKFGFTEQITKYLQDLKEKIKQDYRIASYTLRRILVMKVNMTNVHFHFPIQVNFFLGDKKNFTHTD